MTTENANGVAKADGASAEQSTSAINIPYGMIKHIEFNNLKKEELIDIPHCARLQYRLMLHDAIIKAKVEFVKRRISVIYNHPEAENKKPKISRNELIEFLKKEGINVDASNIAERDYDYVKEFYSYAFFPPEIRHSTPYGWTREEYAKIQEKRNRKEKAKKGMLIFGGK
ncbi:MAG: hypothetical protein ACP5MK_00120 [Candidatus Micrarchaeia archaeon]